MIDLKQLRREYGQLSLLENTVYTDPFEQFALWFNSALKAALKDANAMVLSTVDAEGYPDSRVVLLKEWDAQGFVFFTHYQSHKGQQLAQNPRAALNFYWAEFSRQVRIRGEVEKITAKESAAYFNSRSLVSQASAAALQQSSSISNRQVLLDAVAAVEKKYAKKPIPCPTDWGGYRLVPEEFEFFQGRNERLHDRLHFFKVKGATVDWEYERLAP